MSTCTRKGPRCAMATQALVHLFVGARKPGYSGISRCIPCSTLALSASEEVHLEDELRGVGLDRDELGEGDAGGQDLAVVEDVPGHRVAGTVRGPEEGRVAPARAPRAALREEPRRPVKRAVREDEPVRDVGHRVGKGRGPASQTRRGTAAKARGA